MIRSHSFRNSNNVLASRSIAVLAAFSVALATTSSVAAQQTYSSPEEAVGALVNAARSSGTEAIVSVLGPEGADVASSGDDVADAAGRERFVEAYDAKNALERDGSDKVELILGEQEWPFPIPLIQTDGKWSFDVEAGRDEILARRIGRNELSTMQAILAYVDAQNEYAEMTREKDGVAVYAQRIVSQPGKKDGLYWPAEQGERSPLGDLVAKAAAEGYTPGEGRAPYHGYYYKVLTKQGSSAEGGAYEYVVGDKMIGGFALIAYPSEYENSGVMTFLVNHDGIILEKDLGSETAEIAERIMEFNPDDTWQKAEVDDAEQ